MPSTAEWHDGHLQGVDDGGNILMRWSNGCGLSLIPEADEFRVIKKGSGGEITEKILTQVLAIRDTGEVNMFSYREVQRLAYERDFYELVCFIEERPKEYFNLILTGKTE